MISFLQPDFIRCKAKWNTKVRYNEDGYKRASFCQSSLLPSRFSTILHSIRNHQLNRFFDYYHLLFTYDVDDWFSTEDNQYGSNQWAVWHTTMPGWQCGSIREKCWKYTDQRNSIRAIPESISSTTPRVYIPTFAATMCRCTLLLVLAIGPGKPRAVRIFAGSSVQFSSKLAHKPDQLCLGGVVTWTGYKPAVFWAGLNLDRGSLSRLLEFSFQFSIWILIVSWQDQ